jgi:hypothetical protein
MFAFFYGTRNRGSQGLPIEEERAVSFDVGLKKTLF